MESQDKILYIEEGSGIFKKIIKIFVIILIIALVGVFWWNNNKSVTISLEGNPSQVSIPLKTAELKLARGNFIYAFKKEKVLNYERYLVGLTNIYGKWKATLPDPTDIYSASYELYPYDEKNKKVMDMQKELGKKGEISQSFNTREEAEEFKNMMDNVSNKKISLSILSADENIREKSKKIKANDVIIVSGTHFKRTKIIENGIEKDLSTGFGGTDLFYLTGLDKAY